MRIFGSQKTGPKKGAIILNFRVPSLLQVLASDAPTPFSSLGRLLLPPPFLGVRTLLNRTGTGSKGRVTKQSDFAPSEIYLFWRE